jgi:hypothetical protein
MVADAHHHCLVAFEPINILCRLFGGSPVYLYFILRVSGF